MGIVSESDALTAAELRLQVQTTKIKLQDKTNRNKITNPGAGSGYSPESSPKTNYLNPPHRPMVDQISDAGFGLLEAQACGVQLAIHPIWYALGRYPLQFATAYTIRQEACLWQAFQNALVSLVTSSTILSPPS